VNVIIPIIAAALLVGLGVRRVTMVHWVLLSAWIMGVIVVYYLKN
jgi:hypothetical protein